MRHAKLRSPSKRARGLGAAHSGVHHFWVLRVTALALIPLCVWFMLELIGHILGADRAGIAEWLHNPLTAIALAAMTFLMFIHARLGIQEIIADYVPHEGKKVAWLLLLDALIYGFMAAALLAILHLHLFGVK